MYKKIFSTAAILLWTNTILFAQNSITGKTRIDIHHYKINLRFDWKNKKALGETTILLGFITPGNVIHLDANDLSVISITTAKKKNIAFRYDTLQNDIELFLGQTYHSGENLEIIIHYETMHHNEPDPNLLGGSFGKGIRFFQPSLMNPIKRKQIWSQSELNNASYWYPCTNNIADMSSSEFICTVEKGLTVVSNGKLVDKKINKDGTHTFHYKADDPHPAYLNAFVAGEYSDLVQHYKNIPLHSFCYPDEKDAAIATTVQLADMMRFLSEKTGISYPFKQYSQVMVQDYPFPGLTGQHTFSIISDNMIDDPGTHQDFLYLWDGVEFNALASQWFGNTIMAKNEEDIWLTKSFAQYFEGLYTAERNGIEEYLLWYHPWETGSVFFDWNNGNRHPIVPEKVNDIENFSGDSYAKYRGALVLRLLRKELGDEGFFKSIQYFVKKYAFKPVITADFKVAIKEATGVDMEWFFDQWIYKTGHPIFRITNNYDANNKLFHLSIKQVQPKDTSASYPHVNYFKGKMELEIDNRKEIIQLLPQEINEYKFNLLTQPKLLNIDVEKTWIAETEFIKPVDDWIYQLLYSTDMYAKNAAMNELTTIAKSDTVSAPDKNKIISAFQNAIQNKTYWRFRFNCITQLRSIQSLPYDKTTTELLVNLINEERSWIKAAAISSLGMTKDSSFAGLYISCFKDSSDRVVNAAATALGKTHSSKAFEALNNLIKRPSWKNQSLMHALNGFAALGDKGAEKIAVAAIENNRSARWFLGNGWDYPFVAAQTLATLGKTDKAFSILYDRLKTALRGSEKDDIFHQLLLITTLSDPKSQDAFEIVKEKYRGDANAMASIQIYEDQFKNTLPKK